MSNIIRLLAVSLPRISDGNNEYTDVWVNDMKFKMAYSFLNDDIDIIEKELEQTVRSDYPLLSEAGLHLLQAGANESARFLFCFPECLETTTLTRSNMSPSH